VWAPVQQGVHFPHMAKHDAVIWERFLTRFTGYFDRVAYDIALGGAEPTDPAATAAERRMWRFNTAKRIDAAIRNAEEIWLCEVRKGAGLAAVGAVLGYLILSELDKWADAPLIPTLVTDATDEDIKLVCRELDIQVIEFPDPPAAPITEEDL